MAGARPLHVFIHIPKTAGTSLVSYLYRNFPLHGIYHIDEPLDRRFDGADPDDAFRRQGEGSYRKLRAIPPARRRGIRLIYGHVAFGLHELFDRAATYFTMLRDPVERVVSTYRYILEHPNHFLHRTVKEKDVSLAEYVRSYSGAPGDNMQTRYLAGTSGYDTPVGGMTEEVLRQAVENLERHVAVAGLTERFAESILLYNAVMGLRRPEYCVRNVSTVGLPQDARNEDVLATIRERNRYDVELYRVVRERFERQLATHVPGVAEEAGRLKEKVSRKRKALERDNRLRMRVHGVLARVQGLPS